MGNTSTEIYGRMKADLKNPASKMEGSFTADNLLAVSNELARIYSTEYDRLIARSHYRTAFGDDLDVVAKDNHGMVRNPATAEEVNLTIMGQPGTVVNESMRVSADGLVYMVVDSHTIGDSGIVQVLARCTSPGSSCSVPAGTEWKFLESYEGVERVFNEAASSGGYDAETDEKFKMRIEEAEREIKGYGNFAWYRKTALEVKVFDLPRGLGTVDVVIIAKGNTEASDILIKRVAEHIESERVPGADVKVESGHGFEVTVSAAVYLSFDRTISSVLVEFKEQMKNYFENMGFYDTAVNSRVSHAKVIDLLMGCQGVIDVENVLINGTGSSLVLEKRSFPILLDPVITVKEEPYAAG